MSHPTIADRPKVSTKLPAMAAAMVAMLGVPARRAAEAREARIQRAVDARRCPKCGKRVWDCRC